MMREQARLPIDRGEIGHSVRVFGLSSLENGLEVYLPHNIKPRAGLIIAGQHGDEADGTHLLSRALRLLPVGELKCAVVLSANPDGVLRGTRGNARGVDLNRNFPTQCWASQQVKHKWSPYSPQGVQLNTGASPSSEPETKALLSLVAELNPTWIISIHSPLACVDDVSKSVLGQWIAEQMHLPLVDSIGYATPGSFGQWCKEQEQPLITLELPDGLYHMDSEKHLMTLYSLLKGIVIS